MIGIDEITVYLNGTEVARSTDWMKPVTVEITRTMREGSNVLAVRGWNGGALAMLTYGHLRNEHSQQMAQKVRF